MQSPRAPQARRQSASAGDGRRLPRYVLLGIGAITLLVICVFAMGMLPGPGDGALVEVEWPNDSSGATAGDLLKRAGLVRSATFFRLYVAWSGGVQGVDPGLHLLSNDMSPRTLLRRLRRLPGGTMVKVTVPEGLTKFDVAHRMHDAGVCSARALLQSATEKSLLQALHIDAPDAEGYLFPATYEFMRNTQAGDVVRRMTLEADRRYSHLFEQQADGLASLKTSLGWGKHQVVTLASVVEKEAAVDDERPLIASVFLNRLRDTSVRPERRKLQSDPTARYGCLLQKLPSCEMPEGKITSAMVHDPANPYSTYAHPSLPPGPISNPSEKSVLAVLAPAQSRFSYFYAKGNGRHTFSETYDEHKDAIHPKPR